MILDTINNLTRYSLLPHINDIIHFIDTTNIPELQAGDIPILDDKLYVKVLKYTPMEPSAGYFETHEHYADLQYIFQGSESMFYVNPTQITPTNKFQFEGDFKFFEAHSSISELVVSGGEFTIFLPGEPHKPGCKTGDYDDEVIKLVFKIKML